MKRTIVISLLVLLIAQLGGLYIVHYLQWAEIRQEIKHKLKNSIKADELTEIVLNHAEVAELQWTRENEFSYKGRMYDVVKTSRTDSLIKYSCISDEKEDALFRNLKDLVNREMGERSSQKNSDKKGVDSLKLFFTELKPFCLIQKEKANTFNLFRNSFYSNPSLNLLDHPPEIMC